MQKTNTKTLAWITLAVLLLGTLLSTLAIFVGGVNFSNPLPQNPFKNESEIVILLIAPFQIAAAISALKWSFKMFFNEDWETVIVDKTTGKEVGRDKFDGCVTQLMVAIATPILAAVITYMVLYTLIFFFMQVASFVLPFLIPAAMLIVALLYGWFFILKHTPEEPAEMAEEGESLGWLDKAEEFYIRHKGLIVSSFLLIVYLASTIALLVAGFGPEPTASQTEGEYQLDAHHRVEHRGGKAYFVADYGKTGSLQLGEAFVDNSNSDEGLYNRIERTETADCQGEKAYNLNLYMNDEHVGHIYYIPSQPELKAYTIFTPRVSLPNGIHPGMSLREAMEGGEVYATATYYPEKGNFGLEVTSCGRGLMTEEEAKAALTEQALKRCKALSASDRWLSLEAKDFKKSTTVTRLHIYL